MHNPLKYIFRSLFARKMTTILTILGISLVSFLFCGVLMLADGVQKVLKATGEADNIIFIQKDKFSEVESSITPDQVDLVENMRGIAFDNDLGELLMAPELVVSVSIEDSTTGKYKNITLRGVTEPSTRLRRHFKLTEGELFQMGLPTCISGRIVAEKMKGCGLGDSIKINNDYFRVVGVFETGGTIYDSEVWADIYSLRDSYNRGGEAGSIILARLIYPDSFPAFQDAAEAIPDLNLDLKREAAYYSGQAEGTTFFLKLLGIFICVVFALGASIGAMITMYSAVANRTTEIATMRALGFSRLSVLLAFLIEAITIGIIGAVIGILGASILSVFELQMFSTINFFGEFYLKMTLTMMTILLTFAFAILMGLVGGVFPSVRASRMKIVEAFRAG